MAETWKPLEIYERGLEAPAELSREERVIFLLIDLETCAAMEGWDHFFTSERMQYYDDMRHGLREANDLESLQLLEDYEAFFREQGVEFRPEAIENHLCHCEEECERDWRSEYDDLSASRWDHIRQWLKRKGFELDE